MHIYFSIKSAQHYNRTPLLKFSPTDDIVAVASGSVTTIYAADGTQLDYLELDRHAVLDLVWSANGEYLAVLYQQSEVVYLWMTRHKRQIKLTLDVSDPISLDWSYTTKQLAIGSGQGHLFTYDAFTSARIPYMSKHQKKIYSLVYTMGCDNIVTLSPEALIVSNNQGQTIGFLKQKATGCIFLGRLISCQIKAQDRLLDAVALPVYVNPQLVKRAKSFPSIENSSIYIMILNVDSSYLTGESADLLPNLLNYTQGNFLTELWTQNDADTLLDLKYMPATEGNPNYLIALLSSGNVFNVSLDHSRQDMAVQMNLDQKFKYGTIIQRRSQEFVQASYMAYQAYLEDINTQYNMTENTAGAAQFNMVILRSLCPTSASSLIQVLRNYPKFVVPFEKSFNMVDVSSGQNVEKMFIDFTGGKNSLGVVTNFPTNITFSRATGVTCMLSFSNGSTMMLLTTSVSNSVRSVIDEVVCYPSRYIEQNAQLPLSQPGMHILSQTQPKVLKIAKMIPCQYSDPIVHVFPGEIQLPAEPQCLCVSSQAFGYTNGNNIMWSTINVVNGGFELNHRTSQQMNIRQMQLLSVNGFQIAAVRTADGQVALHAGGGVTAIIELQNQQRIQQMVSCSPLLYCFTEKSVLLVYNVDASEEKIYYNLLAEQQFDEQFNGQTQKTAVMLELMPGGVGCFVYKQNEPCNPAVYLPAENLYFEDIFKQQTTLSSVLFDSSLIGLFVAFNFVQKGEQTFSNENYTGSVNFSIADQEGPGIIFYKYSFSQRDITQLPNVLSNGVALLVSGTASEECEAVKGLANVASAMSTLSYNPPTEVPNCTQFINYRNPITPVSSSAVVLMPSTASATVQLMNPMPEFAALPHPSLLNVFSKAILELCNFGFTELAMSFAARLQRVDLLKIVADAALRFADFDTAAAAYGELSLHQQINEAYDGSMQQLRYWFDGQTVEKAELYCSLEKNQFMINMSQKTDPAAVSLFLNRICLEETDLNTALAYSLLISCPDVEKFPQQTEKTLDQAEHLLLKSNRPGLALSFRVDSLDWETASNLAKKISSPYVRSEILIQQAGEVESKQLYPEAIEICQSIGRGANNRLELAQVPKQIQPNFIGILARAYCFQGKVQECRELALPPRVNERYARNPKDPLNILQRARLCYECGEQLAFYKRFTDAANFYEAAAQLANGAFKRLSREIQQLSSAEVSLYDIVMGNVADEMMIFQLVDGLREKCRINYDLFIGSKADEYDIKLLKDLDNTADEKERKAQQASLPQKIADIVAPADLAELDSGGLLSKAANCYIKGRYYDQAEALIDYVTDKNTIADLARVYMRDNPEKALELFKRAGKSIEIVECLLSLKKVKEAESAVREVRIQLEKLIQAKVAGSEAQILDLETEFRESSLLLAVYYKKMGAAQKATYFFIMGEAFDEAFDLATATNNEDILIKYVTEKAPNEFLKKAAKYFAYPDKDTKKPKNLSAAARFLELSGSVENAIKLLLNYGNGTTDIDSAIYLLKKCKQMVDYVLKYLQGGSDGVKKNPIFIFKLYLALERYQDAAKTAFVLADREIALEHYGRAKALLLSCMARLKQTTGHAPQKFRELLTLLHAVDVGRQFAKLGLHAQAAVCLYRAARVSSRFGKAASSVLISACVECSRASKYMYREAYQCACALLKEYDDEIPAQYRKPIEYIVRKFKKDFQQETTYLNCCYCTEHVKSGLLSCDNCHAILPLDSATGNQMTLGDYCECPHCNWTCSRLGLYEIYNTEQIKTFQTSCMMCGQAIDLTSILLVDAGNYQLIASGKNNWDEYEHRPLIVYEDSSLARKRYEEWVKIWENEEAKRQMQGEPAAEEEYE